MIGTAASASDAVKSEILNTIGWTASASDAVPDHTIGMTTVSNTE